MRLESAATLKRRFRFEEPLRGGGENVLRRIRRRKDGKVFVLKIFSALTRRDVVFEAEAMRFLARRRLPVPRPEEVFMYAGGPRPRPAMVYPYAHGANLKGRPVAPAFIRKLGRLAGRVDKVMRRLNGSVLAGKKTDWDLMQFRRCRRYLGFLPHNFAIERGEFLRIFADYEKIFPALTRMPRGLIHNDVSATNVIVRGGRIAALLDFSDMVVAPYACNVAIAAAHFCFDANDPESDLDALVDGYRAAYRVAVPRGVLLPLIRARLATLILSNHYRGRIRREYRDTEWMISGAARRLRRVLRLRGL